MPLVLPTIDDGNRPFWDGCRDGALRLQRCEACSHLRYPVSTVCPRCLSTAARWEQMSGEGSVYSFIVFRHAYNDAWRERIPYTVALVELAEGPTLISNIVGIPPEEVRVGLPVSVAFEAATDEVTVPVFRPSAAGGAA